MKHKVTETTKMSNLLDKRYETAQYYNQPGRAFYITLRYHPLKS